MASIGTSRRSSGRVALAGLLALAAAATAAQAPNPLEGSSWKAVELAGVRVPSAGDKREPFITFKGGRVTGSDGCNRFTGSYELKGESLTFGEIAGTRMACPDTAETERRFQGALKGTSRWRLAGGRLEFYGATGKPLAVFERREPPPAPAASPPPLQGSSWQLVRFRGGDDTTLMPGDKARYTIAFAAGGQLTARIDCNRGRGTWKSTGPGQLDLSPPALTRARCPEGSLHDRIVKHWPSIRSYVIRDGHLFLSLMAGGGTYEWEPMPKTPVAPR